MFNFFKRDPFVLVKTFDLDISYTDRYGREEIGKFYYHLYESKYGKRKYKITSDVGGISQQSIYRDGVKMPFFNRKIYRWIEGRHDPEIPRYSEIGEEDTVAVLRGKV